MLRDIVEQQKKEISELQSHIEFQRKLICRLHKMIVEMDTEIQELKFNEKNLNKDKSIIKELIERFNNLPWYKKMFFKFEICKDQK